MIVHGCQRDTQSDATKSSRNLYTGREFDAETGLYYYRAKYYDPATGRFLSEDPIGFLNGDRNLYVYVGNQPTAKTDPSGLQSLDPSGKPVCNKPKPAPKPEPPLPVDPPPPFHNDESGDSDPRTPNDDGGYQKPWLNGILDDFVETLRYDLEWKYSI